MAEWRFFSFNPDLGRVTWFRPGENGDWEFWHQHYDGAVIERNKTLQNMETTRAGYSPSSDFRRIGSLPSRVVHEWRNKEGFDPFDANNEKELMRRLNSSDYRHLRTALWNL